MRKILILLYFAAFFSFSCQSSKSSDIISIYYDDQLLIQAKEAIAQEDPAIMEHYIALKNFADSAYLTMAPISIVDDKIHTAPSRDPRDYISLSPYWWPNPDTKDGLPYLRNDGVRNPEVYEYHERARGEKFGPAVQTLAVLYYLSGEEKYAQKAAELIRTWFLDPKRGMNPNMTYAQYVPGMERIRGTGIIDSRRFMTGLNAAQIIKDSQAWSSEDEQQLKRWAAAFSYWLENSVNGLAEFNSANNHGLWYETILQMAILYSGDYDYLRSRITNYMFPRIDAQVAEDGSLPHELARTLGLHYTTFSLEAINLSNIMGSKVGVDLWGYVGENGRSAKMAVDYALPYYLEPETWPHMQIKPFTPNRGALILYHAGKDLGNEQYSQAAAEIGHVVTQPNESISSAPGINAVLYYKLNR